MRYRRSSTVFFPWEERYARVRGLIVTQRWSVLVILALIVYGMISAWRASDTTRRLRITRAAIAQAEEAVAMFRRDMGRCPRSAVELLHPPRVGIRYLTTTARDGWGQPLRIRCPHPDDDDRAEVVSSGPSGSFFADDNIESLN